jgi:hypothetical protein
MSVVFVLTVYPTTGVVHGRQILCLRCLRVALFSEKIYFFPQKMNSIHKKKTVLVSPDVSLTSVVIRQLHLT